MNTYLYMPVVPTIGVGEVTVKLSAYSQINIDHEEHTLSVSVSNLTEVYYSHYDVSLIIISAWCSAPKDNKNPHQGCWHNLIFILMITITGEYFINQVHKSTLKSDISM